MGKKSDNWFLLNILTPENAVLLGLLGLAMWQPKILRRFFPATQDPYLVPLLSPVISCSLSAFFSRIRENREHTYSQELENLRGKQEEYGRLYDQGEEALKRGNYSDAAQFFNQTQQIFRALYSDYTDDLKRQLELVVYKQALSLFYAMRFDEALNKIQGIRGIEDDKRLLSLRAFIYFKQSQNVEEAQAHDFIENAKQDFKSLLNMDANQNTVYICLLFLEHKCTELAANDALDLESDNDLVMKHELQRMRGEVYLETKQYEKAIAIFIAAEAALPKEIMFLYEKALLQKLCANAYEELGKQLRSSATATEKSTDRTQVEGSSSLSAEECTAKVQELSDRAKRLYKEISITFRNHSQRELVGKLLGIEVSAASSASPS